MIRILHLADLHLGWMPAFLGDRAAERRRERDALLARAVDFALNEQQVDVVIIAGDLFETHRPDAALIRAVISDLERLTGAGITVITVPGNHDEITYHDSVYREQGEHWPGILIQNPMPAHVDTVDIRGTDVHIYGLAYTGGITRTQPPISDFPRLDEPGLHIAVFHGSLDWDAGERSLPLLSSSLAAARYDYVALGHIHQHSVHKIGSGTAVYCGAIEGKTFSDPGVDQFTVATVDSTGTRMETFPAGARPVRVHEIDVTALDDGAAVEGRIAAQAGVNVGTGAEAIVRVRLIGAAPGPLSLEALQSKLGPSFYHLEIVDETATLDAGTIAALADEPTVRGQFVRRLQSQLADAADEAEQRLLARAMRRGLTALEGGGR